MPSGKGAVLFEEQDYLWKGLAGSEVLVHRSDENYNLVYGHAGKELEQFLEDTKDEPVSLYSGRRRPAAYPPE